VKAQDRPLPDLDDPVTAPFWQHARDGELRLPACAACGVLRWPASTRCPECLGADVMWRRVSGRGRVWSMATYHRAFHPAFVGDVPYVIATVQLLEGPTMIGRLVDPEGLGPGDEVTAVFEPVTNDVTLVRFAAAADREPPADVRA
jgi:uncharacterized protein